MEWQFRKILESTENYRAGSARFISLIQQNNPGVVKTIVREIQLIMSDPNANIFSKVLAMRFARDIMVLGRQDVINELVKIVPHMLQVCSFRLESDDPDRGESYFYNHPQYASANSKEKQVIESYGSTYFILNLQSMYHWGNWVKVDQNGNQSIYHKGLNTLIERAVRFPTNFHYYKNSDTQKFKNTYRVQFFSEQSQCLDSSRFSSHSKSEKGSSNSFQTKQLQNYDSIINGLHALQYTSTKRMEKLSHLKNKSMSLLENKYNSNMIYYGKQKVEKKWLQNFIVNHNLLIENKISFQEFMKRVKPQTIQLPQKVDFQPSLRENSEKNGFKKTKSSAKREMISKGPSTPEQPNYQQLLLKQQQTYGQLTQKYKNEISQLTHKIQEQKMQHDLQKKEMIKNYEDRILNLKKDTATSHAEKNEVMIKQNDRLRQKLYEMQRSLQISRARETESRNLTTAFDLLKVQNENLKKQKRNIDEASYQSQRNQLIEKIRHLQKDLQNQQKENKSLATKIPAEDNVNKKLKQMENINDQLMMYKNTLKIQREQFDKKSKVLESKIQERDIQIRQLKEKVKSLHKRLDLRDIQAVQMNQQMKLLKLAGDEKFMKSRTQAKGFLSEKQSQSNEQVLPFQASRQTNQSKQRPLQSYNFKKYENLRNITFRNEKQRYLRFCRCCLKKKDLIMKDNQLQIGLISQPLSNNEVKYILHLTNMSQVQINEIRIFGQANSSGDQIGIQTQYVFCLQQNQQEKINVFCRSPNFFSTENYQPLFLIITYMKNSHQYQTRIAVPFVLFKTLQLYKLDKGSSPDLHNQLTLTFPYSQKMVSESRHIYSFFPPAEQTIKNKFECDCLHRESGSRFRIEIYLKEDTKMMIGLSPIGQNKAPIKQQQALLHDLMGFFEFCFRK